MTRSELAHEYPDVFAYLTAIGTLEVLPGQSFYDDAKAPEPISVLDDDDDLLDDLDLELSFDEIIEEPAGEVVLTCERISGEQVKELEGYGFTVNSIEPITGYVVVRFAIPADL